MKKASAPASATSLPRVPCWNRDYRGNRDYHADLGIGLPGHQNDLGLRLVFLHLAPCPVREPGLPRGNRDYYASSTSRVSSVERSRRLTSRPVREPGLHVDLLQSKYDVPCPVSRARTGTTPREPGLPRGNRDYHVGTYVSQKDYSTNQQAAQ